MDDTKNEKLLTADELALALNCSKRTVSRMISEDNIPFVPVRGSKRYILTEVLKHLRESSDQKKNVFREIVTPEGKGRK